MMLDPARQSRPGGPAEGSTTLARAARAPDGGGPAAANAADGGRRPDLGADCWFLSGPTASGKTARALDLARDLGAEIVSVDSMAVYRGLDVGTAKPTADERRAVPHHVIDVAGPSERYSVARWLDDAAAAVADCRARGRRILFVGGTPLYLRALRDGLAPLPPADPALRATLAEEARRYGSAALHARLATIDPASATRIHENDTKRIIRALEVAETTGRPLSAAFAPVPHPVFETQFLVLDVPRDELHERIDRRVERMFSCGIVEETAAALAAPGGIGPTARQAAGYAEAIDLLAGTIDRPEAIRRTQVRTRQLAKRQLTWLRSFPGARWIPG
ncbi:MAG: tRNA (adenosine(37)-N6)-dimethylallyltransferase MiaA [Planctomycetaceae bacterium]